MNFCLSCIGLICLIRTEVKPCMTSNSMAPLDGPSPNPLLMLSEKCCAILQILVLIPYQVNIGPVMPVSILVLLTSKCSLWTCSVSWFMTFMRIIVNLQILNTFIWRLNHCNLKNRKLSFLFNTIQKDFILRLRSIDTVILVLIL